MKPPARYSNLQVCVAFFDLDNFKACMKKKGWNPYKPNPITSAMTRSIQSLISTHYAYHLWGLDPGRGTEEAILMFYDIDQTVLMDELEKIRSNIKSEAEKLDAPTSVSIGVSTGFISKTIKPFTSHKVSAFRRQPIVYQAYKALLKAKKRGGNQIVWN